MIPKECKRLAEVDFPIAVVSKHAAREKSIRHGHPSTLHLWWARRPLASSRAVLLALLLPDPCDAHCPVKFKNQARTLLPRVGCGAGETDEAIRQGLFKFIGDFANWDLSTQATYLEVARGLVKAAHPEETPLVVDPFGGGGSIPLEALRVGCDAYASDLNPVATLILKVMLEDIPRQGAALAAELRKAGGDVKKQAEQELADFYPADADGARPIAYLWARTVRCEEPDCGANIPLFRTGWLAARKVKGGKYKKLISFDLSGNKLTKVLSASIQTHPVPTDALPAAGSGTVKGGKATCVCCGRTMTAVRVKAQLSRQAGGADAGLKFGLNEADGATLLVVVVRNADRTLSYRMPTAHDFEPLAAARIRLQHLVATRGESYFPNEPIGSIRPSPNARGVSGATRIGISDFGRLFTTRQKLALRTIVDLTASASGEKPLARMLGLAATKLAERCSSFVTWINSTEAPRGTFARQALTIAWDFVELVPWADQEEFLELIEAMAVVTETLV